MDLSLAWRYHSASRCRPLCLYLLLCWVKIAEWSVQISRYIRSRRERAHIRQHPSPLRPIWTDTHPCGSVYGLPCFGISLRSITFWHCVRVSFYFSLCLSLSLSPSKIEADDWAQTFPIHPSINPRENRKQETNIASFSPAFWNSILCHWVGKGAKGRGNTDDARHVSFKLWTIPFQPIVPRADGPHPSTHLST